MCWRGNHSHQWEKYQQHDAPGSSGQNQGLHRQHDSHSNQISTENLVSSGDRGRETSSVQDEFSLWTTRGPTQRKRPQPERPASYCLTCLHFCPRVITNQYNSPAGLYSSENISNFNSALESKMAANGQETNGRALDHSQLPSGLVIDKNLTFTRCLRRNKS